MRLTHRNPRKSGQIAGLLLIRMSLVRVQLPEPRFPQIPAVFLYFCHGNLFRHKEQKIVKKHLFFIHFIYKIIHLLYGKIFIYFINKRYTNISKAFRRFATPLTHGIFVRVSPVKNDFFDTKINTLY